MAEDFDFERFGREFNEQLIALEEVAKTIVPMFTAFRNTGLTVPEAASLTAAFVSHTMPPPPQQQQEE